MQVERFSILKRSERLSMAVNLPYGPEQPRELRLILDRSNVLELILLLKGYSKYVG